MYGNGETSVPGVENDKRTKAIESVNGLFNGFIEKFGTTDCKSLTNCDFSKKEEVDRYMQDEVYKHTCFKQFEYVLSYCLARIDDLSRG